MQLALKDGTLTRDGFSLKASISFYDGLSVVMGPSGSGKTTLLSLLSGLERMDGGSLMLDGETITGYDRRIGIIFQHPERQLFAQSVFDDVSFSLRRLGLGREERRDRTASALREALIDEKLWRVSPFALSGGERRRAAIAGVVVFEPSVLLMDEPTVGLDAPSYGYLMGIVERFRKKGIVVMATHDDEAASRADRIVSMDRGRIVADGASIDVLSFPGAVLSRALGLSRIPPVEELAALIKGRMA